MIHLNRKLQVKIFTATPHDVENSLNIWLESNKAIEVVKIHRPVMANLGGITVLVEYNVVSSRPSGD